MGIAALRGPSSWLDGVLSYLASGLNLVGLRYGRWTCVRVASWLDGARHGR